MVSSNKKGPGIPGWMVFEMIKQKIIGLLLFIIGIIEPIIFDGEATLSVLIVPLGIYAIFTKEYILHVR